MRMPIKIQLHDGTLRIDKNPRIKRWQSIPAPSGNWTPPDEWDESGWTDLPFWGSGVDDRLLDPVSQVAQYRSWVKICVDYNARAVGRQAIRLYSRRALKNGSSRKISRDTRQRLHRNAGLERFLRKASNVEEVVAHPVLDFLGSVSAVHNATDLWQLTETYMGLTGNCYWLILKEKLDEPTMLWFLESQRTRPVAGATFKKAVVAYLYRTDLKEVPVKPEDVVHHKYPNPENPIIGMSPMRGLVDAIKVNENIYRYERAQFQNMARPDAALEVPETLTDEEYERLKTAWKQEFKGSQQTGKFVILEGGTKFTPITMSARDLAHLEGRKVTREEIAAGYGVPLPLLSPDRSNRAVSSTAYAQYMRDTIDPKLKQYEQRLNEQLLPMFNFAEDFFMAFDDCVPADMEFKLKERRTNLETGYTAINELREEEGMEEVDWGDRPILPSTMMPLAEPGEEPVEEPKPGGKPPGTEEEEDEEKPGEEPAEGVEPEKIIDLLAKYVLQELEEG